MDFEKVVYDRYSVRDFSSKDVPNDVLKEIIKTAQRTPSWTDSQPWKVYIAKGKTLETIQKLHLQRINEGAPSNVEMEQIHRAEWDEFPRNNTERFFNKRLDFLADSKDKLAQAEANLFHAPVLVYLTLGKKVSPWMIYDTGAFGQTLMLAAKNKGIDSIPAYEIVRFPEDIHKVMGIPDHEMIVCGIALGYPTDSLLNDFHSDRLPVEDILKIKE